MRRERECQQDDGLAGGYLAAELGKESVVQHSLNGAQSEVIRAI